MRSRRVSARGTGLVLVAVLLVVAAPFTAAADSATQFGCSTAGAILVNGATPSAECTFAITCPLSAGACGLLIRIDVNGTGQVQGSLASTIVPTFPQASCGANFHCGETGGGPVGSSVLHPYRCAANGFALLVSVTCSAYVYVP